MQSINLKIIPEIEKASLTFSTNYRLFSTREPILGASAITAFSDDVDLNGNNNSFLSKKFRYSKDRGNWSLWYNIQDATNLSFNNDDLFIEVKYEYNNGTNSKLANQIIVNEIEFTVVAADDMPNPFTPTINCSVEKCPPAITTGEGSFSPYETDEAVNIFKQLSFNTNITFGHEVIYFKTEPDRDSADYVFKEWTLAKTINRKCIKILVPGNKFPSNKPTYAEFGIDFELPFEVNVDHQYFQTVFGAGQYPRKKDFLYFPLTNRMYEIQGSYLHRGIMQEPVFWKVQLVKFQPNIDVLMKAEDRIFLDNIITNTEELLGEKLKSETVDAVNPQQYKTISGNFDETRAWLNPQLKIRQSQLTYNYSPLVQYYYDLSRLGGEAINVIPTSGPLTSTTVKFENSSNLTLLAYQDSELFKRWIGRRLSSYDLSGGKPIKIKGPYKTDDFSSGYIKIERYSDPRFTQASQIPFQVDGSGKVTIFAKEHAVVYNKNGVLSDTDANLTYFSLVKINTKSESIRFIESYSNADLLGIKITGALSSIIGSQNKNLIVSLEINDTTTQFDSITLEPNKWYAIFVPVSVQFKQAAVTIYGFTQDPVNSNNFNGVSIVGESRRDLSITDTLTFNIVDSFRAPASDAEFANIRVFDTMVQEEDHDFVISQLFIRDESILRLIDNCRPRLNIPYIGKNR